MPPAWRWSAWWRSFRTSRASMREYRKLLKAAERVRPDLAILTDSPDFHLRLARKAASRGHPRNLPGSAAGMGLAQGPLTRHAPHAPPRALHLSLRRGILPPPRPGSHLHRPSLGWAGEAQCVPNGIFSETQTPRGPSINIGVAWKPPGGSCPAPAAAAGCSRAPLSRPGRQFYFAGIGRRPAPAFFGNGSAGLPSR